MSHSAEGVSISELSRRGARARTTKMARVWELVSELIRVLVSREQQPPTSHTEQSVEEGSAPAVPSRRAKPRRKLFARSSSSNSSMPSVWHDVQSRALQNTLQRKAAAVRSAARDSPGEPAAPADRPQPTGRAGEIDWSPFLIARIHDDFARPQVMPD